MEVLVEREQIPLCVRTRPQQQQQAVFQLLGIRQDSRILKSSFL